MARPYLQNDEFLERVAETGYTLRYEQTYSGNRTKYNVVCPKHPENIWIILGSNLISKKIKPTCPVCSSEKQRILNSFSHSEVVEMFEKDGRGYKIRDGHVYISNKTNLSIVCPEHPDFNWITRPLDVIKYGKRCPICVGQQKLTNEIIDKRLLGRTIKRLSDYVVGNKVLFRCELDAHEWYADLGKVMEGTGCPKCSNCVRWTSDRVDDWLKMNLPSVIRIGDFSTVQSLTKFKCLVDGYEWEAQFGNVRNGYGCACCSTTKRWNNDLAERWLFENRPNLSLVGELNKGNVKSKFYCKIHDLEFERSLYYIRSGSNCPECVSGGGFKTTLTGFLYYAKVVVGGDVLYKIGITNRTPEKRVSETKHPFEILDFFEIDGILADKIESIIINQFRHLRQQKYKFSGSTECFTEDIRKFQCLKELIMKYTTNPNQGTI